MTGTTLINGRSGTLSVPDLPLIKTCNRMYPRNHHPCAGQAQANKSVKASLRDSESLKEAFTD
ncbi:hypothetical protein CFP75_08095 [Amycolatopsis alba DSM 44262]|uniref:Uncharacterized protein n=1 Tax=Amycolatopsis alba DSM 44262 TaxID=1125972 RepID=A0A229S2N5_AMYAL|nr:hypothetical protein CFP75_08095 [Amycolatopsis alba DSM 44262]